MFRNDELGPPLQGDGSRLWTPMAHRQRALPQAVQCGWRPDLEWNQYNWATSHQPGTLPPGTHQRLPWVNYMQEPEDAHTRNPEGPSLEDTLWRTSYADLLGAMQDEEALSAQKAQEARLRMHHESLGIDRSWRGEDVEDRQAYILDNLDHLASKRDEVHSVRIAGPHARDTYAQHGAALPQLPAPGSTWTWENARHPLYRR
jgi:hypothetical protein